MNNRKLIAKAVSLREQGKTYSEINKIMKIQIQKNTFSSWFKNIILPKKYYAQIRKNNLEHLKKARIKALFIIREKRKEYLENLEKNNLFIKKSLNDKKTAKIALTMLYWAEGSKSRRGALVFGNSDPQMIKFFLKLLKICYYIDQTKFRCTVQCRADQNLEQLKKYWLKVTNIPINQFYETRIDPRTIGKKSKNSDYMGVCRIDYFSGNVYNDLMAAIGVISMGI